MKLFKLVDGVLELDKEEIRLYKELNTLLVRDKGSVGDSDGRKKLKAFKEFKYLYFICDYGSYPNQHGFNEREAHKYAIDQCDLPKDYIPDEPVLNAMDFYIEHTTSVPKELIIELIATFRNNIKVVKKLRNRINKIIDRLDNIPEAVTKEDIAEEESNLLKLIKSQKELIDIANTIPDVLTSLKKAENLLKQDEANENKELAYGSKEIEDSMDPDKTLG